MRVLLVAVYIVALIVTGLPRLTLSGAKLELSAGSGSSTDLLLAGLADDNDDDPLCEALLECFRDRCIPTTLRIWWRRRGARRKARTNAMKTFTISNAHC
jgi:hypothetical protein